MGSFKQDVKETFLGISESAQDKWNDFTQFLEEAWPLLIFLLVLLMGIWWYADPPPPNHVVLATGPKGSSYEILGKKYAEYFEKKGVTLELAPTKGAGENIQRLVDRKDPVQAAFVQAGVIHSKDAKGVLSLGAIAYDPVWFFYRGPVIKISDLEQRTGQFQYLFTKKISIGEKGSGTYFLANRFLDLLGLTDMPYLLNLSDEQAVKALAEGKIDGAYIVDAYESPNVQAMLNNPELHIVTFERAAAFVKLIPYLHILGVPQGSFNLKRNFPSRDINLVSATTNLLVDDRMHPAIQFLFLEAAQEINGRGSFFAKRGEFPSFKDAVLPDSPIAVHYERNRYPLLSTYVPFWLAELINRLVFILLPFLALAYPILQALPGYRAKRMQNKINRLYGDLKAFEQELVDSYDDEKRDEYLKRLNLLEYQALRINISKRMSGDYYTLRTSIDYVRNCLNRRVRPYQMTENINMDL